MVLSVSPSDIPGPFSEIMFFHWCHAPGISAAPVYLRLPFISLEPLSIYEAARTLLIAQ